MKNKASFVMSFLLGVGLTIASIILLGAASPKEAMSNRDTQIVPIAGGLALILAVNDHETDRLHLYQIQNKKEGGKVLLKGSIDLSETGKDVLPGEIDME